MTGPALVVLGPPVAGTSALSLARTRTARAALALAEALAAGCARDLDEMEVKTVLAAIVLPALPAALALATRDPDEVMTLAEVAAMLRVTVACVAAAARAGRVRLRIERIGRKRCVRVRDLDEVLAAGAADRRRRSAWCASSPPLSPGFHAYKARTTSAET